MDIDAVKTSYRRWAPVYDYSFGLVSQPSRRKVVHYLNSRPGKVLEVGVGTGLALPYYDRSADVTGIDFSHEMLAKAQARVERRGLTQVKALRQMDARHLDFPDASFDTVVAMFLVSVVPDPEQVVAEMARVCKPGGEVVIANHFARDAGFLASIERGFSRYSNLLGWHSDFPIQRVTGNPRLSLSERKPLTASGLFTFLRFQRLA